MSALRLSLIRAVNALIRNSYNAGVLAQAEATSTSPACAHVSSDSPPSHPFHSLMKNCYIDELRDSVLQSIARLDFLAYPSSHQPQPEGDSRPGPSGTIPPGVEY